MPQFTSAYSSYLQRCDEVLILVRKAARIERARSALKHGREIDALCRGSLVLLSSHVEAYVKELGECLLDALVGKGVCRSKISDPFFYHASRVTLEDIRKETDPQKLSENVFSFLNTDSPLWSKVGVFPRAIDSEQFNRGFSNPKFDKVQRYLARFGYHGLRHDLNVALKADGVVTISKLDQIVDIRNAIAHGEASATRTPSEVAELVDSAKTFCRAVDAAFTNWCWVTYCPIR